MRLTTFIILFFLTTSPLIAQSYEQLIYSPFFNQFAQVPQSINPALVSFKQKGEANLAVQFHPGAFSNFNTTLLSGNIQLSNPSTQTKQIIGLLFTDDSEGKLLNRNFIYAQYALQISLTKKLFLSSGFQLGMASVVFHSTSISPGFSAYGLDGSAGINLHSESFNMAVSLNQLFNSSLENFGVNSILKRYFTFVLGKKLVISPDWKSNITLLYQTDAYHTKALNTETIYNRKASIIGSWNNQKGLGIGGGITSIPIGESLLKITLTYYTPLGLKNRILIDELEFLAGIFF